MIYCGDGRIYRYRITWSMLDRHERKAFHRENESRRRRGLPALDKHKPHWGWTNGGY